MLRFLAGLRVGAVLDRVGGPPGAEKSRFGIRLDTLAGHLLHGSEWIQVVKEHQSGAVRLRIEVRWRSGPLPAWWMRPASPCSGARPRPAGDARLRRLRASPAVFRRGQAPCHAVTAPADPGPYPGRMGNAPRTIRTGRPSCLGWRRSSGTRTRVIFMMVVGLVLFGIYAAIAPLHDGDDDETYAAENVGNA